MEPKQYDILLDIKKYTKTDNILLVKGDNRSNVFNITIKDESEPYDLTGLEVQVVFGKFDNTTVVQTKDKGVAVVNPTQGKVKCELLTNSFSAEGKTKCEVRILQGEAILTSASFEFWVRKPLFGDDTIKSSNDFPYYEQLIQASKNEGERITNENTRISNENTRKSNESTRVTEEGKRVTRFNQMEKAYKDAMNFSANQATLEVTDARLGRKNLGELNREIMEQLDESKLATISTNSFVTPLPEVQDGVINIESIEGNTLQNIIVNGDFAKGFTNWAGLYAGSPTVENGIVTVVTRESTNKMHGIYQQLIKKPQLYNKIYVKCEVMPPINCELHMGFDSHKQKSSIKGGIWNSASGISERRPENNALTFYTLSTMGAGELLKYKNMFAIDLTETFGVGKEPSLAWCDANLNWFDGIQHVESCVLKSVGKNLFDGEMELGGLNSGNGGENTNSNSRRSKNFIHLEVGTTYKISQDGASKAVNACFYYQNKSFLQYSSGISTITMPSNAYYVKFYYTVNSENTEKLQIEKGSAITPYEPYKESIIDITQFINTEATSLKRLPNGVSDILDTKKSNIINKITRRVFTGATNESWSVDSALNQDTTIFFRIRVTDALQPLSNTIIGNLICGGILPLKAASSMWLDDVEGISLNTGGFITIRVLRTKLATQDVAGLKSWLSNNNLEVYYELNTPTVRTIPHLGALTSFKDGTLFMDGKIPAYVTLSYPTNLGSRVQTVESELDKTSDSLYRAWLMIIALADKQLRMSMVQSLTTETNTDLKNKINEILTIWR